MPPLIIPEHGVWRASGGAWWAKHVLISVLPLGTSPSKGGTLIRSETHGNSASKFLFGTTQGSPINYIFFFIEA